MHPSAELELQYIANNSRSLPLTLIKGDDVYVYDEQGKRYLDFMSAISVNSFGHCHPALIRALTTQAGKLSATSRLYHNDILGPFLQLACQLSGFERALPMNTGAEAIETAIKAARKWAYLNKPIAEDRAEIIVCQDNFHGRTVAAVSMSSQPQYREHFGPFTPGFKHIPFNDADALSKAITPNTAAFIVEPIQGEAGVQIPDSNYLQRCADICHEHNVLLICDEIQSGMGRTGKFLASQYEKVQPDAIVLGKALGGGILPVSLFLANDAVMSVFQPGDHGSTFGGNPLAAAVGLQALQTLCEEQLIENAKQQGDYFIEQLKAIDSPVITAVRGKGLFIAIEINLDIVDSATLCSQLIEAGLLTINTRGKCLRILPPLTVTSAHIDEAIGLLTQTLAQYHHK